MDKYRKSAIKANENYYITHTSDKCLESIRCYYGNISRETCEWVLNDEGCKDGMYLLRSSNNDYVLSLCYHKSVLHYRISRLVGGEVILQGLPNQKFSNLVSLIDSVDGLACKPLHPINTFINQCLPPTHWGLSAEEVRNKILLKAENEWGVKSDQMSEHLDTDLHFSADVSPIVKSLVHKTLHEIQPWFHCRLSRVDAETRIVKDGHKDGKFLVRERDDSSYAVCLSHQYRVMHYRIDVHPSGCLAIQDGPLFDSIMALISYYTIFSNGLWCALTESCPRPQQIIKVYAEQSNFKISRYFKSYTIEKQRNAMNSNKRCVTSNNIKIKEWITTINHKWSQIRKQAVIHNKHKPLISDKTDYRTSKRTATHQTHQTHQTHAHTTPSHDCCCYNHHNMHSFNVSHEEPVIGSGNIFNLDDYKLRSKTIREHTRHYRNNRCDNNMVTHQRLVKSSSIDTLEAVNGNNESIKTVTELKSELKNVNNFNNFNFNSEEKVNVQSECESLTTNDYHCKCSDWLLNFNDYQYIDGYDSDSNTKCVHNNHFINGKTDLLTGSEYKSETIEQLVDIFTPTLQQQSYQTSVNNQHFCLTNNCDNNMQINNSSNKSANIGSSSSLVEPINNLLAEFDICFNNEKISNTSNTCSHSSMRICDQLSNTSTDASINEKSVDSEEIDKITSYKNDANIRESSEKSISIALTDLDNADKQIRVQLKDIDLIRFEEEEKELNDKPNNKSVLKLRDFRPINFDSRCITLGKRIGNGYFGDVYLATITSSSNAAIVELAVKTLKKHAKPHQRSEILSEARIMASLDHKHIIRLIGICDSDILMLVMELAPLGPITKYLHEFGSHLSNEHILRLMLQVSNAMKYLESKNYVHRDLAARNVLLVSEYFAKVSDFGMSRALTSGKDYYKARSASKWPLKWFAPECIYYYKFSSKSDVWSYGVTLWEVMSRGETPYQGMDGQQVLKMFQQNRRLSKPDKCPLIIYHLMLNCWHFSPELRITFTSISHQLKQYLDNKKQ